MIENDELKFRKIMEEVLRAREADPKYQAHEALKERLLPLSEGDLLRRAAGLLLALDGFDWLQLGGRFDSVCFAVGFGERVTLQLRGRSASGSLFHDAMADLVAVMTRQAEVRGEQLAAAAEGRS